MIGIFNDTFPPAVDGIARIAYNYAFHLSQKGHSVCAITPKISEVNYAESFDVYSYRCVGLSMSKPYKLGIAQKPINSFNAIKNLPLSLVHAHSPFITGKLARSISVKKKIPFVASFHSNFREEFRQFFYSTTIADYAIRNIVSFYESADEVWVPHAGAADLLIDYGFRGRNIEIVTDGCDFCDVSHIEALRQERRVALGVEPETPLLLFVGQLIYEKNIFFLIECLAQLRERILFKMVFVGDGADLDSFREQVRIRHLQENTFFTGMIYSQEKLASYYAASDLLLFPSLADCAPLVLREAASLNTPSLLIEGSVSANVIEDNRSGFLAAPSEEDFVDRIAEILSQKELLRTVSLAAGKSLSQSWKDVVEEVYNRYQHIINKNR